MALEADLRFVCVDKLSPDDVGKDTLIGILIRLSGAGLQVVDRAAAQIKSEKSTEYPRNGRLGERQVNDVI